MEVLLLLSCFVLLIGIDNVESFSVRLEVPKAVEEGGDVELRCHPDVIPQRPFNIRWTRNNDVFFTSFPRELHTKTKYNAPGINVDLEKSSSSVVLLRQVSVETSGRYACEVSTGAPAFITVTKWANMTVIASEEEVKKPERRYVMVGSKVELRCDCDTSMTDLSSIKWYHHNHEFFRFRPRQMPYKEVFPLAGVRFDVERTKWDRLVLDDVELDSSGSYTCRVFVGQPEFSTCVKTNIIVVEPKLYKCDGPKWKRPHRPRPTARDNIVSGMMARLMSLATLAGVMGIAFLGSMLGILVSARP